MKQTRTGRWLSGLTIAGLLMTGAMTGLMTGVMTGAMAGTASAASEVLSFYPTSVAPTLPSREEITAMQEAAPRGIVATLQDAHRRSVDRGWMGVPALDRSAPGETAAPVAHEPLDHSASSAAPPADARPARYAPKRARAED